MDEEGGYSACLWGILLTAWFQLVMVVELLDGANRATATKAQLETYDLLRAKLAEGRKISSAELLAPLGLTDIRPLISRIKHLAEKGFLRLRPETEHEAAAVA